MACRLRLGTSTIRKERNWKRLRIGISGKSAGDFHARGKPVHFRAVRTYCINIKGGRLISCSSLRCAVKLGRLADRRPGKAVKSKKPHITMVLCTVHFELFEAITVCQ